MPIAIDRIELKRLLSEEAAQLVEVLPAASYSLPGAINIQLREVDEEATLQAWSRLTSHRAT